MKTILSIAIEEWRYWLRSKLALSVFVLFSIVLMITSLLTAVRIESENAERTHHQAEADDTFASQPDRHPHRMVHYGHYVFRTPTPLSLFDPGIDSVTGKSMFLEGHRQGSAMFSSATASADLGKFSWLTPAIIYQVFGPLLIILLGYGAIVREREAKTLIPILAQGLSAKKLLIGKVLALLSFVLLLVLPIIVSVFIALLQGESFILGVVLIASYFIYLMVWGGLSLLLSCLLRQAATVLAMLVTLWLVLILVLPSIAVNIASKAVPMAGKVESELIMLTEESGLSDGHYVSASRYDQIKEQLFKKQGVDRLEDLDVNIRGVVALQAEQELTDSMNTYAEARMADEIKQVQIVNSLGWITPILALSSVSRTISATDLEHHHRFLRQAEALRFTFVQGLNKVHAEQLDYEADIHRSDNEAANRLTRMSASNWQVLENFQFEPAQASNRLVSARPAIVMLLIWLGFLGGLMFWAAGRLKP